MIHRIAATFVLIFFYNTLPAQTRYYRFWIGLKDKDSTYSITQPEQYLSKKAIARRHKYHIPVTQEDLPVSNKYVQAITQQGFRVLHTSRWLNAVTVQTRNKALADSVKQLPFVTEVRFLGERKYSEEEENNKKNAPDINEALSVLESKFDENKHKQKDTNFYGKAYQQVTMLNVHRLHELGYMGEGITVAVLDAGFKNAKQLPVFRYAFDSSHVKGTKDFIDRRNDVFDDDDHGMAVWGCMAAYVPYELVGTSPKADFWLLRSEYILSELPVEEAHWIAAAEYADSLGADVINSSLGYNQFDDASLNHQAKDLDGKTTLVSRAAAIAATKGILIINSAGNEGDNNWRYICPPADAPGILTVGAVDKRLTYAAFSSIGTGTGKQVKPDVAAMGEEVWVASAQGPIYQGNGTSYACPIMAGAVTCLLQANPSRSPQEIIRAIQQSASQYYAPDKFIGYGIPDMLLANAMLGGDHERPLKKDAVLDARILDDRQLHVTLFAHVPQKIKIEVESLQRGKPQAVITETIDCKNSGVTRTGIKAEKLPKGTYAVYIHAKDGVSSYVFNKN